MIAAQRWGIGADLSLLRALGFRHIRLLTVTKGGDPAYAMWPDAMFLSFPEPTAAELEALSGFAAMTRQFGMTFEVVVIVADASGHYYKNGVTSADYRGFFDAVWGPPWAGALSRIYFGGDLRLGDADDDQEIVANHRDFILREWPYFVAKCPQCGIGINLASADRTLYDRAVSSIAWARTSMSRPPSFFGCQLYPTTHAWLRAAGWERNGVVDWSGLVDDWIARLRSAAGPISVHADEVGMLLDTAAPISSDFTPADQRAFLTAAWARLTDRRVAANLWEFADHEGYGNFGIFDAARNSRPVVAGLPALLAAAARQGLQPGIQYGPPEYADLQWLVQP